MAPAKKVTSSADRSKRAAKSTAKVSGAKPSNRANRSSVSTAKVSGVGNFERANRSKASTARVSFGSGGGASKGGSAPVTQGRGSKLATAAKVAKVVGAAKSLSPAGIAYDTLKPKPAADATLTGAMKRGDYKPKQGPAVPARLTQGGMDKGSFNSAFKASRTAGKKTFSWRGKKYTTKKAGE
jgi:hypothetical protein